MSFPGCLISRLAGNFGRTRISQWFTRSIRAFVRSAGPRWRSPLTRPAKAGDSLKFQIYTRRAVIILILTPGRGAICSFRPFRALHGGLICQGLGLSREAEGDRPRGREGAAKRNRKKGGGEACCDGAWHRSRQIEPSFYRNGGELVRCDYFGVDLDTCTKGARLSCPC